MPRYVFTCSSEASGGLFLLDSTSGQVTRAFNGPLPGVTRGPDSAFYAVSGFRSRPDDPKLSHPAVVYRLCPASWRSEAVAEFPMEDAHDLRWWRDSFYLVGSDRNEI